MINENTGGKIHFPDGNLVTGARKSSRVLVWGSMTNNKIENFGNDLFSKIDSPRTVMRSITMFTLTFGINTSESYYRHCNPEMLAVNLMKMHPGVQVSHFNHFNNNCDS